MRRWLTRLLVTGTCLLCFGCLLGGDPMGRKHSLQIAQRRYTDAIRWGQFDKAEVFVVPEVLEEFHAYESAFDRIRITDYEIGRIVLDDDRKNATVDVTYRGYLDGTFVEKPLREVQAWTRISGNDWWVRPNMSSIVDPLRRQPHSGAVPASR